MKENCGGGGGVGRGGNGSGGGRELGGCGQRIRKRSGDDIGTDAERRPADPSSALIRMHQRLRHPDRK